MKKNNKVTKSGVLSQPDEKKDSGMSANDQTPPRIVSVSPVSTGNVDPATEPVVVKFSEPMNESSVIEGLRVYESGTQKVGDVVNLTT